MLRISIVLLLALCAPPGHALARDMDMVVDQLRNHPKLLRSTRIIENFLQGNEKVKIIVRIKNTADLQRMGDLSQAANREALQTAVRSMTKPLLDSLPAGQVLRKRAFKFLPAFAAEVTPTGLEILLASDLVESVAHDTELVAHTLPELTLTDALTVRAAFDGSGVSVAISDTGVDYTHPALDGSKYLGGYDFGDNDTDPMDLEGHGTSVAGIAVGEALTSGDYIGGVAPGAGYYALKMTPGNLFTTTITTLIDSWEWAILHKNDDPPRPIVAINTSFGTDAGFETACDGIFPTLQAAAQNAKNAGITVFASSGNEYFSDKIAAPACVSAVISVGAVSDTDAVAPFSNTADYLDIFAPGVGITTPRRTGGYRGFTGTSASSPFAAGVALVLQSAQKATTGGFFSPAALEAKLKDYGTPVTDTRPTPDVTKPRTNVGATDIDADGLPADWEVENFGGILTGPSDDTDGDGLTELQEFQLGTDPNASDSDGDGMPDGWENQSGLNPLVDDAGLDPDGDGYTNGAEYLAGTGPNDPQSFPRPAEVPGMAAPAVVLTALLLAVLGPAALARRKLRTSQA
jgi:subtilisin family serine protease